MSDGSILRGYVVDVNNKRWWSGIETERFTDFSVDERVILYKPTWTLHRFGRRHYTFIPVSGKDNVYTIEFSRKNSDTRARGRLLTCSRQTRDKDGFFRVGFEKPTPITLEDVALQWWKIEPFRGSVTTTGSSGLLGQDAFSDLTFYRITNVGTNACLSNIRPPVAREERNKSARGSAASASLEQEVLGVPLLDENGSLRENRLALCGLFYISDGSRKADAPVARTTDLNPIDNPVSSLPAGQEQRQVVISGSTTTQNMVGQKAALETSDMVENGDPALCALGRTISDGSRVAFGDSTLRDPELRSLGTAPINEPVYSTVAVVGATTTQMQEKGELSAGRESLFGFLDPMPGEKTEEVNVDRIEEDERDDTTAVFHTEQTQEDKKKKDNKKLIIIVSSVVGGLIIFIIIVGAIIASQKRKSELRVSAASQYLGD